MEDCQCVIVFHTDEFKLLDPFQPCSTFGFFYFFVTDRAPLGNRPAQSFPVLLFGNSTLGKICTPEPSHWTRKHFYCVTHLSLCIARDLELSQGLVLSPICHTHNIESSSEHSFNFQCTTLGRPVRFFSPLFLQTLKAEWAQALTRYQGYFYCMYHLSGNAGCSQTESEGKQMWSGISLFFQAKMGY